LEPIDPYCQGDLDGLCGLYAIVNALSTLCPEIDEDIASGLFGHLARHIQVQRLKEPMPIIAYGIGSTSLRILLQRALRFVRRNLEVEIASSSLRWGHGTSSCASSGGSYPSSLMASTSSFS
jgi:hypothetical protein